MYGKIFEQIFDSSIIEDRDATYVFMSMIILSDEEGTIDITRSALSRRINLPITDLDRAIEKLESCDPASRSPACEGKRIVRLDEHRDWGWFVVNKTVYAKRVSREEKKRADRIRISEKRNGINSVAECRIESRVVANVAHTDTDTDTDKRVSSTRKARAPQLSDESFIQTLKSNPAYRGIDIDRELSKIDAWLMTRPGRVKTRRMIVNWLNRCERPLSAAAIKTKESTCKVCGSVATFTIGRDSYCSQHSSKHWE